MPLPSMAGYNGNKKLDKMLGTISKWDSGSHMLLNNLYPFHKTWNVPNRDQDTHISKIYSTLNSPNSFEDGD